jgi:hypothetical protein
MALEVLRVRCLGMTADGSKQLRPGTPLTSNRSNAPDPAMGGDDIILGRAVP